MLIGKVLNSTGFNKGHLQSWNNWPFTLKKFKSYNSQRKKVLMLPVRFFEKSIEERKEMYD